MLSARRLVNGLIADAGVGNHHAELTEQAPRPMLVVHELFRLAQEVRVLEIDADRVARCRNADAQLRVDEALQVIQTGILEHFGIAREMGIGHRHEPVGTEELADADLLGKDGGEHVAASSIKKRSFLSCEMQRHTSFTSGRHLRFRRRPRVPAPPSHLKIRMSMFTYD